MSGADFINKRNSLQLMATLSLQETVKRFSEAIKQQLYGNAPKRNSDDM